MECIAGVGDHQLVSVIVGSQGNYCLACGWETCFVTAPLRINDMNKKLLLLKNSDKTAGIFPLRQQQPTMSSCNIVLMLDQTKQKSDISENVPPFFENVWLVRL